MATILFLLGSCMGRQVRDDQLTVFCASSLTPVVEKMKEQWEKDHHEKILISSASSGTLSRQIENGAEADIFLSANEEWMSYIVEKLQLSQQVKNIASNRLVVVAPLDSKNEFKDINEFFSMIAGKTLQIAIGDPDHVPLGKYTKEVIENRISWQQISSNLVPTKDARSALRLVELEEVDFGIVYQSDSRASKSSKVVFVIPGNYHKAITYQAILLNDKNTSALKFLEYLSSVDNKVIWAESGFSGY